MFVGSVVKHFFGIIVMYTGHSVPRSVTMPGHENTVIPLPTVDMC